MGSGAVTHEERKVQLRDLFSERRWRRPLDIADVSEAFDYADELRAALEAERAAHEKTQATERRAVELFDLESSIRQRVEDERDALAKKLEEMGRIQDRLSQVALEAIRVVHCDGRGDPRVFEPCTTCGVGGTGELRHALTRALGDGYANLVWGNDMNIDGEAWTKALEKETEKRAVAAEQEVERLKAESEKARGPQRA
jgi:hypothetical protein